MTPKERIALKEAQARKEAFKKTLRSHPSAVALIPDIQAKMAVLNNPNSTADELNSAMDSIEFWLGSAIKNVSNSKPKGRGQVPDKFKDTDKVANERATLGRERPKSANVWKDVNDWRDVTDYTAKDPDRNPGGVDSTLIRIMIPKRKGVDIMDDIERIENEIGALSHHISYVEGVISGETGSHWSVDFTVEWDFNFTNSGSARFANMLLTNIQNNIEGIGSARFR